MNISLRGRKPGTTTSLRAVVFLILFALPFAGVGMFAGYLAGSTVLHWIDAMSWEEVPARILSADLDVSHGDDSTTYRVEATYEYIYRGQAYTSDQANFGFGSDNIGSFHQDKYAELAGYVGLDRRFRCFVDPDDPGNAVLYRELRWGMLFFEIVFALTFSIVGFGIVFAAIYGGRVVKANEKLKQQRPDEPWMWEKSWADGRVRAGSTGKMISTVFFAVLWNLISSPVLFFVGPEVAGGNRLALLALVFPLVGLLLATWAVYTTLQWRKFGNTEFEMYTRPGVLGGRLEGRIHTNIRPREANTFHLTLSCVRKETTGSGDSRSTRENVLWQDTALVESGRLLVGPHGASVPVGFTIPYDAGPESEPKASDPVEWRLEVTAPLPGIDYSTHFAVPVYRTEDSDPALELDEGTYQALEHDVGQDAARSRIRAGTDVGAAGIVRSPIATGGVAYVFQRARAKGAALGLTVFTVIWCGFIWLMLSLDAPMFFPIVFGLFSLLLIAGMLDMWLKETRVEIAGGTLALTRRMVSTGKKLTFDAADVGSIKAERGMQAGNKLYYRIILRTRDGKKHTLASQIGNQRLAKRLTEDFETALAS